MKNKRKSLRKFGLNPRALGTNPRAMSKRRNKSKTIGESNAKCRDCRGKMSVRTHISITQKMRSQFFYFTQWDYCDRCKKVYFDEKYKKLNPKGAQLQEVERQQSFFKSL